MADIRAIFDKALTLIDGVNEYLPGAGVSQGVIDLARKADDLIASFGDDIPLDKQDEAKAARAKLAEKVRAKASATSARLRG